VSTDQRPADVRYVVEGGHRLEGTVFVQGAKNAALPMIAASLLAEKGQTVLHNVPLIDDVRAAVDLARAVGAEVQFHEAERVVVVDASTLDSPVLPASVAGRFRASILFLPPLLLRLGEAVLEDVGGCRLGSRNLDFHYRGFARLGAHVEESASSIRVKTSDLRAASLYLDTPSHTGTENLMAAAALIDGTTVIENTAMEPEVVDFARFLSAMGARIEGAGTGQIEVEGVKELTAVEYTVMPDRIDFGALAMMAAATGGDVTIVGAKLDHLGVARWKLEQMGVELESSGAVVRVRRPGPLRPINVVTAPFPGFASDLQSPITALAALADGVSYVRETIFDGRYLLARELQAMGAEIKADNGTMVVTGGIQLTGCPVVAHDLRTGISLVLAGLAADGVTVIEPGEMIDRGHSHIDERLSALGARVERHALTA
jgi:UDP-N-acetylglucosamine 1-carboxyvinyltransferase